MSVSDDIRQALLDAIGWQQELARAHAHCDDGVTAEANLQITKYRRILKRRYGDSRTPFDAMLEGAQSVALHKLQKR